MNDLYQKNEKIKDLLLKCIRGSHISHAYMFYGGSRDSRTELGNWFAQALLCSSSEPPCDKCLPCRKFLHGNHEDMFRVVKEADRETISVEQINSLADRLSLKPIGSRYVVLFENAEQMNASAQNKLLKTLEEPVSETIMILLCDKDSSMLATVTSRCVKFSLSSSAALYPDDILKSAELFVRLALDNAAYYKKKNIVLPFTTDKENGRIKAMQFIDALEDVLSSELDSEIRMYGVCRNERLPDLIRMSENSRKSLIQLHSVAWTIKQLCLQ